MPYSYTGKELDASGLHYYEARYYDAVIGRFISPDPLYLDQPTEGLEDPQSLNLYAYALNNPLKYIDPDGARPTHQILAIPIRKIHTEHPRSIAVFTMKIEDYGRYGPYRDIKYINAEMTLLTDRGGKYVPVGTVPVKLKFTALPNSQIHSVPGTKYGVVYTPHTTKSVASCPFGPSICSVSHRSSGGKVLGMELKKMEGTFELYSPDLKTTTKFDDLRGGDEPSLSYYAYGGTGLSNMPTQVSGGIGVGVNLKGGNAEDASHIISNTPQGPVLQKAEKPPCCD
jgi:RHS repeat-associated protein